MRVRVIQAEARYTASFVRPAYEFVGRWVDFFAAIHHRFSEFGGRPDDIRWENSTGQPQDFSLAWINSQVGAVVRYRLGSFEVWTREQRLIRGETPPLVGVILAATAAARDIASDLPLASQTAVFQGHVQLEERTVASLVEQVVQASEWATPDAVKFQVAAGEGAEATVDFQRSLAFPDPKNAWAGLTVVLPGTISPQDVGLRTMNLANEILERTGVELDWGS